MKRLKDYLADKTKKHGRKFTLFFVIGMVKMPVTVLLNWLLIDRLHVWALFGSAITTAAVVGITYIAYVATKVMKPAFLKYIYTNIAFNILTILLTWVLVDFAGLSGAVSSLIIVALFLLRYASFNKMGLIEHG